MPKSGWEARCKVALGLQANLDFVIFNADGTFDIDVGTNWSSAYLDIGLTGHMDCVLGDFTWDGACSARLDAEFDGSYIGVTLRCGDKTTRYWYDKGQLGGIPRPFPQRSNHVTQGV